jgi:hypothetical protein
MPPRLSANGLREGHRAEVEAEMLDEDSAVACSDVTERMKAVQMAFEAEAARREAPSVANEGTNESWDLVSQ